LKGIGRIFFGKKMFSDRIEAGLQLAEALSAYKGEDVVVIAIPRGGLPVGAVVAKALEAPLDVALSKKLGHPHHKEYAIGAVSLEHRVLSDVAGISHSYLEEETGRIREKLRSRQEQYYEKRTPSNLKGKTVILVDDGVATGNTIMVTAALVQQQDPAKTIAAIPVAPPSAVELMKAAPDIDEVVCLLQPHNFFAVGQFYERFDQVSDAEAIELLAKNS